MTLPPNPSPRPTPLTDAAERDHLIYHSEIEFLRLVVPIEPWDLARQLERDRAELMEVLREVRALINRKDNGACYSTATKLIDARLSRLTEEK